MIEAVFNTTQAQEIIQYVKDTHADSLQFLWQRFPKNAIWRCKENKKWYGALLVIQKSKLGLQGKEEVCIIDLQATPAVVASSVDGIKYLSGYHMNKRHWYTIVLDGSVPTFEICQRIEESYALAKKKK